MNWNWRNLIGSKNSTSFSSLCFSGRLEINDGRPVSDWMIPFFILFLYNWWSKLPETWQEAKTQSIIPILCFWPIRRHSCLPHPWFAETFRLFLKMWTEFDEILQEAKTQRPLQIASLADQKAKIAIPASYWLIHYRFFISKHFMELNKICHKARTQRPLPRLCFRVDWRWQSRHLIGWDVFDFSSEIKERNLTTPDRKPVINVLHKARTQRPLPRLCFRVDWRWQSRHLIGWDIFDFSSATVKWILRRHDWKAVLGVLYNIFSGLLENRDGIPVSDLQLTKVAHAWFSFCSTQCFVYSTFLMKKHTG